jgi:hypothetical protein
MLGKVKSFVQGCMYIVQTLKPFFAGSKKLPRGPGTGSDLFSVKVVTLIVDLEKI